MPKERPKIVIDNTAWPDGTEQVIEYLKPWRTASSNKEKTRTRFIMPGTYVEPPVAPAPPTVTPSAPLVVSADDLVIADKSFSAAPGSGYAIWAVGTATNHITDLVIRNCTFSGFQAAIWVGFVDNVLIEDCVIDGPRYAGIMALSAVGGTIQRNTVRRVAADQGALTNAYGIAISQQNPSTDPPSTDVLVYGNTVEDVPTWEALDTHGGQRITFRDNIVRRSRRGVMVTGNGSGGIARDCVVDGNQFLAPISNPAGDQYAVVLVGSSNAQVTANTITGWGTPLLDRAYLRVNDVGTTFSGNTVS